MTIEQAERVQVKFYVDGEGPTPSDLIPVFHRWIRDQRVDDPTLIDVADYTHVYQGPGVVLIGHGGDWYYDLGEGRPGMMYSRKRHFEGALGARLVDAIRRAAKASVALETDLGVRFGSGELLVRVPDRLHVRNDADGFEAFAPILEASAREVFGPDAVLTFEHAGGPKDALCARVRVENGPSLAATG